MSLTYGFYNSLNGDRKYNATQMSSIFDGIIKDGVFATIGSALAVTADSGLTIKVGTGRAWFNHTWTLNDTVLQLTADESEMLLSRIDAVVLEINASENVRANSIKIVKGTPASSPLKPVMTNNDLIHQYPLCYIRRTPNNNKITQANITNAVGTTECPFVTGVLTVVTIDDFISQWKAQFDQWMVDEQNEYDGWLSTFKAALQENANELDSWMANEKNDFTEWFDGIKNQLSGDIAVNLTNQLNEHVNDKNNPHGVTPESIGASASDHTHPTLEAQLNEHVNDKNNPHGITPEGIGAAASGHTHPTDTSRAPAYSYGTSDLTAGLSLLETGKLYFVYE